MADINGDTRNEWIIGKLKALPKGGTILDAGAGEQPYKKYCAHLNYVSQDFNEYDPSKLDSGLQMGSWDYGKIDIVCDILNIPKPDASFDAILCSEVFEHIPDPISAMKEFARLLKPKGYLILTAPFCSLTHFAPYHYCSGFNHYFYEKHLPLNHFNIIEISPNGNFFTFMEQELNRIPYIMSRYVPAETMSYFDKKALKRLSAKMGALSPKGTSSSELLTFGYHVFAQKQG